MRQVSIILILLFATINLFSQTTTIEQIENDLHKSYQKILFYRLGTDSIFWDSLEIENKIFRNKLEQYTSKFPLTLTCNFDSLLKDNIDIVTSDDKLFRIYSWNTFLGGTMKDFGNVFQYKAADKVYSKIAYDSAEEDVYIPFYSHIFTLKANGKSYYLAVNNGIYSTKDASQSIKIFTIENNSLNDTMKIIKTEEGLVNSIDVYFDFFSVIDKPERPLRLIKYDAKNKIIYIPVILGNGEVTDRYTLYQFTGQYFEYIKRKKNK